MGLPAAPAAAMLQVAHFSCQQASVHAPCCCNYGTAELSDDQPGIVVEHQLDCLSSAVIRALVGMQHTDITAARRNACRRTVAALQAKVSDAGGCPVVTRHALHSSIHRPKTNN
jgi:hypothetical protein